MTEEGIDVGFISNLARLQLSAEEATLFQGQLSRIVDYVHQIAELDLEGIEPTSHAHLVTNVFRDDTPGAGLARETVLKNAPACKDHQFSVPKIIE